MTKPLRLTAGILGVSVVTILAHLGYRVLQAHWVPIDYTPPGRGGLWAAGIAGRLLWNLGTAAVSVLTWSVTTGVRLKAREFFRNAALIASVVTVFSFVTYPYALFSVLPPAVCNSWQNWARPIPILGEIYCGYGFVTYQWLLVAAYGAITIILLWLLARRPSP